MGLPHEGIISTRYAHFEQNLPSYMTLWHKSWEPHVLSRGKPSGEWGNPKLVLSDATKQGGVTASEQPLSQNLPWKDAVFSDATKQGGVTASEQPLSQNLPWKDAV